MDVPFEPEFACPPAPDGLRRLSKLPPGMTVLTCTSLRHPHPRTRDACALAVEKLGAASAIAQRLPVPITSPSKLLSAPTHRVYIAYSGRTLLGLLKVGVKDLFMSHGGVTVEISPTAVLDFFVVPSHRRRGVGRALFNAMCENEGVHAVECAYDRPSLSFLSFLSNHFNLTAFTPQANNFVMFHDAFTHRAATGGTATGGAATGGTTGLTTGAARPASVAAAASDSVGEHVAAARPGTGRVIPPAASTWGALPTPPIDLDAPRLSSRAIATAAVPAAPAVAVAATPVRGAGRGVSSAWTPASAAAPFATDHNSPSSSSTAGVVIPGYTPGVVASARKGLQF